MKYVDEGSNKYNITYYLHPSSDVLFIVLQFGRKLFSLTILMNIIQSCVSWCKKMHCVYATRSACVYRPLQTSDFSSRTFKASVHSIHSIIILHKI